MEGEGGRGRERGREEGREGEREGERERGREGGRERDRGKERKRHRETDCARVCPNKHMQILTKYTGWRTDNFHGLPAGKQCAYSYAQQAGNANTSLPSCDSVYHSCAPESINGTVPRAHHTCSHDDHVRQLSWPFMEGKPPPSTYLFKGDPGLYNKQTSKIESGGAAIVGCSHPSYCDPTAYYTKTVQVGPGAHYAAVHGFCAAVSGMTVESFVPGQVPSKPSIHPANSAANIANTMSSGGNGTAGRSPTSSDIASGVHERGVVISAALALLAEVATFS